MDHTIRLLRSPWLWLSPLLAALLPTAFAAPPSEQTLPAATRAFVCFSNLPQFDAKLRQSQLGKLYNDPSMRDFAEEMQRYTNTTFLNTEQRAGFTYDELKSIAAGEVTWALIEAAAKQEAYLLLIGVNGKQAEAQQFVGRAGGRLEQRGAQRRVQQVAGTQIIDYELKPRDGQIKHTVYALQDDTLIVASDVSAVEQLLRDWGQAKQDCLANSPAFRAVQATCSRQMGGESPDMRWFIDPLGVIELLYKPDPLDLEATNLAERLKTHGFDGVRGVGGFVSFAHGDYDVLASLAIHAPPPRRNALAMFDFPAGKSFAPLDWIPDDVNMFASLYWNLGSFLDHLGPVFDDVAADGIEGTFDDILADLKSAEGPGVDLRKDLVDYLGPRVTVINDAVRPVSATSERSLIAIEVRDEPQVALAVKKLLRDDPGVRRLTIAGHDNDLWVIGEESGFTTGDRERRFSTLSVTVAHGHLMLATNTDLIRKLLRTAGSPKLAAAADLQAVDREFSKLASADVGLRFFSRTSRDFYTAYELVRQGKADRIESLYGLVVRKLLNSLRDKETGKLKVDFSKLPEFEAIEKHLGLAAIAGKNEKDGWLLMGILLRPSQ